MAVILIVDDEVFIRCVSEIMVQDLGHQTLVASAHFMQKPYTPAQLNDSMEELLAAPL